MGRKSRRRKSGSGQRSSDLFRIVVAASPGPELTIEPELDLIKAALLYGDRVTLITPATTMFLSVERLSQFSLLDQVRLMRRLAPHLHDGEDAAEAIRSMDSAETILLGGPSPKATLLRAQLSHKLRPTQEELSNGIAEIARNGKADELERARADGLLQIEDLDPTGTADMVAWCIDAVKRRENGEPGDPTHATLMVETFVERLSAQLESGRSYLMFDEDTARLTQAGINSGRFKPAAGPTGRCAQAMTASGFMARLPTFPDATVDEVLDIRSALATSLTPFRSTMVTLSKDLTSKAWEDDFEDEVHDAWVESVAPAIESIDNAVHENKSLLSMTASVTNAANATIPGLGVLGAGLAGHTAPAAIAGGAATIAGPLAKALSERKAATTNIRMQPFYFLYGIEQALS